MWRDRLILFAILIFAVSVRLFGINWDYGYHLHPDERAIIMFTTDLDFPSSIHQFLSKDSPWNPNFFAYGSFPLYLLKIAGSIASFFNPSFSTYGYIQNIGRFLSAIADTISVFLIFILGRKLFNSNVGFVGALFYAVSVLPIQLSHFYAVDTLLTMFVLLTLYQLLRFYEKPSITRALLVGMFFGFALATKTSALVLVVSIGLALAVDFLLIIITNPHRPHVWFPHVPKFLINLIKDAGIIFLATVGIFLILEPYAFLDFNNFWTQTMQQSQMTKSAFTFPYTLQYVGKIPYWYELKNIFLWGLGPFLATIAFAGSLYFTFFAIRKEKTSLWAKEIIVATFFWTYFFVVGKFAIGFMRYMLPLYPLFCLFAALLLSRSFTLIKNRSKNPLILNTLYLMLCTVLFIWPFSFLHIYTKPPTRVLASEWINKNIPQGSTLAIEHWDDSLPLHGQERFNMTTLELYNFDSDEKWEVINRQLEKSDYIILASNRLYVPLQKLTDCAKLPKPYCYLKTANYYRRLFDGSLGFKKVAEFTVYPTLEVRRWKIEIGDDDADESFTVYDHPKIIIFKK